MLFVSLFAYAFAKTGGDVRAELERAADSEWLGFRTLAELAHVEPARLKVDGSTLIAKARSKAAGGFLEAEDCDVWVTVDDDVFASVEVLRELVAAARRTRGVVAAPCVLRDGSGLNLGIRPGAIVDGNLAPATRVGTGLVAMHRAAIAGAAQCVPWVRRPSRFPALFLERVHDGEWIQEDMAFSDVCRLAQVPLLALLDAPTNHAGRHGKLGLDLQVFVGDVDTAARIR